MTLGGQVERAAQSGAARASAELLSGVGQVINRLTIGADPATAALPETGRQ